MKKLILPIVILLIIAFFLSPKADAQSLEGQDCTYENYYKESYKCLGVFNECQKACLEKAKGSYLDEITPSDKYSACMKSSDCDGKSQACEDQAWADYQACKNASKSSQNSPKESEAQKETPKQNQNSQDSSEFKLPVFVGEWFNAMVEGIAIKRALLGFASFVSEEMVDMFGKAQDNNERKAREYLETLSDDYIYSMTGLRKVQLISMRPSLSDDVVQKLVKDEEAVRKIIEAALEKPATPAEVMDVPGESDIKVYPFGKTSVAVIESPNWENIKFKEPKKDDEVTYHVFDLEQGAVEVKVKNDNPSENKFGVDAGWLGVSVSRTHFYVYRNPDGKSAAVIVYEGEVQIKTMGGKTIKVSPENGEPGMVIITKKLSLIKLVLSGLVLVVVVGSVVFFIRRKAFRKFSKKR